LTSFYFTVIFALRRVILLRSDIRLKPSDIALWAVLEANIISLKPREYIVNCSGGSLRPLLRCFIDNGLRVF